MQKNQRKNQQTNEQENGIRRNGGNNEEMESSSRSWKEILDEKLQRLHSLQFGAEEALENGDGETSLMLNLCLLGFLESQCSTTEDRILASPIIHQTKQRIDTSRDKVSASVDRSIARKAPFLRKVEAQDATLSPNKLVVQTEKCTRESTAQGNCVSINKTLKEKPVRVDFQDDISAKTCKNLTQSKLTSLYMNGNLKTPIISSKKHVNLPLKPNTQDDHHTIISHNSRPHSVGSVTVTSVPGCGDEEYERYYGNALKKQKASHHDEAPCISNRSEISNAVDAKELDNRALGFVTAKQKWAMDSTQKRGGANAQNQWSQPTSPAYGAPTASSYHINSNGNRNLVPKSLGMNRRGVRGNFIPPVRSGSGGGGGGATSYNAGSEGGLDDSTRRCLELLAGPDGELPDKLKNVEPKLIEHISNEIMDQDPIVRWDDIAGLEHAKKCVTEMVIWPLLRPDIFQGCRSPGKGLLLFGPPGTGKTMIGKAIAGEAKATFFSISASSLTSKWIGEGEKLVRALFGVASCRQPAVIFIDEIDSLLSQRKSDGEHESSRRLKTQFLIEMEGCGSGIDQLLLIGATNRPQELDEAARRRLSKRLYIPLPSAEARSWIVSNLLKKDGLFTLSEDDIHKICDDTEGYSGSDMSNLVKEASMGPLREALMQGIDINKLRKEEMRPVMLQDFKNAVLHVKPSVSHTELSIYEDWNRQFGSHSL